MPVVPGEVALRADVSPEFTRAVLWATWAVVLLIAVALVHLALA